MMLKVHPSRYMLAYILLLATRSNAEVIVSMCNSSIFCEGELLRKVQLAQVFPDEKTFVDLKLMEEPNAILDEFEKLMKHTDRNPSRDQLAAFVNKYFTAAHELDNWYPSDFNPAPPLLNQIDDPNLKQFAKDVVGIWPKLGRKVAADVKINSDRYSFIYMPHPFIIPGGRFKEQYYWDTYWIVQGLLISDMHDTAKNIIENLLYLVDKFGYVPNGSRIYYLGRSQPPLLTAMMSRYFSATGDIEWLRQHIDTVEREIHYWLKTHATTVEVNGKRYILLRHLADKKNKGPRPESYYEDYENSRSLPTPEARERFYLEMKSAAATGWDFSTRWFISAHNSSVGNLTNVQTSHILPVDLNAIYAGALEIIGDFRSYLQDSRAAEKWWNLAKYWRTAIDQVLWDPVDGIWFDYDVLANMPRRFFYPSGVSPLWAGAVEPRDAPKYAARVVNYLESTGALTFPGGIPASLQNSGQQWDFPNAWPPLQSIMILGLENSGHEKAISLAKKQIEIWIRANYIGYKNWNKMFEKYNAVLPGHQGGGGEYMVQDGFGWTNGIVLELLQRHGRELRVDYGDDGLPLVRFAK